MTSTLTGKLTAMQPYVLGLFRAVVGLLFFLHGLTSLFGVLGGIDGAGKTISATHWPGGVAAVIELVTGALVMLGIGTRAAAFLASGTMAYAYFYAHFDFPHKFWPIQNMGEQAVLFCWAFFLLVFFGSGAFALDSVVRTSRTGR